MIRIQLDLPEEKVQELDRLMEEAKIRTRKDLFNSAFTLLAWALNERSEGRTIASLDERTGNYKELVMPFFSFVRREPTHGNTEGGSGLTATNGETRGRVTRLGGKARSRTAGVITAAPRKRVER